MTQTWFKNASASALSRRWLGTKTVSHRVLSTLSVLLSQLNEDGLEGGPDRQAFENHFTSEFQPVDGLKQIVGSPQF